MATLNEQVALVTGGGGGIGSAICRRLAAEGARIVITYKSDRAKAAALASSLPGDDHLVTQAPVEDSAALSRLAQAIDERYGRLDILVNNAGITHGVPHDDLEQLDDELIDRIFRVNWRGAFASIRALKSLLMAGDGGLGRQYLLDRRAHRRRQQCGLLRQQSRHGQHDTVAGASIGATNSCAFRVARLGQRRICAANAARAHRRARIQDAAGQNRRSGRCRRGCLRGGCSPALQHRRYHTG